MRIQTPYRLPTAVIDGTKWLIDLRLGEFRDVADPSHRVVFQTREGMAMVETLSIDRCPWCRGWVMADWEQPGGRSQCRSCGKEVVFE